MSNADLADFATEEKASLRPRATGWIVPALAWAFVLAILAFVVPKFEVVVRDFGIDLPWMMMLIVRASHLWLALLGMVVVLFVVDSIVRDVLSARKDASGMTLCWSALMIGLPLFTIAFMVMALMSLLGGIMWKLTG